MVCDASYLQNEFGDPLFFTFLIESYHFLPTVKVFKKICTWELLGTNVLNDVTRNLRRNWSVTITKRQMRYVYESNTRNRLRFIQIPSKRLKKDTR